MLDGKFLNKSLEENFNLYIKSLVVYLKELDFKDILQEDYKDLSNFKNIKDKKESIDNKDEYDKLLYKTINNSEISNLNQYVNIKNNNLNNDYILPEKRDINLKDPKLKKKGVNKKKNI